MKKFKFRLERILNFRQSVRSEKRRVLSLRSAELREAEDTLIKLQELEQDNAIKESGAISQSEVLLAGLFSGKLQSDIVNQRITIVQAQNAVDEARIEYIEAAKEAESLVTLKKRRRAEYDEEFQRDEAKFLDELSIQKGNTFRKER